MIYQLIHTTSYKYSETTPVCHNLVYLTPRGSLRQHCLEHQLIIAPAPAYLTSRQDYFGNQVSYFSIHESHEQLSISARSRVEIQQLPEPSEDRSPDWQVVRSELHRVSSPETLDAYQYAFESPCVKGSEALVRYARESFAPGRPLLAAVAELNRRIHQDFRYDPRATSVSTPVHEVFEHRHGVCQDFAHLAIACLRSLGLAARYVSGYLRTLPPPGRARLVGADASHAWFAVYAGPAGWVDFDPTNDLGVGRDHITAAWGRDYGDVAPVRGVFVGSGQHLMTVSVDVEPLDAAN